MRKILCTLLCLVMVFGYVAVDALAVKLNCEDVDWGLTLTPDDITPTGMVLVIAQTGGSYEGQLEFGRYFRLESRNGDAWLPVPYVSAPCWTMDALGIPPESIYRMEENWESFYGALPSGHYRWVKTFMDYYDGADDYEEADFYVEFVITEPHTCLSKDGDLLCDLCLGIVPHDRMDGNGDAECDICGKKVPDKDIFRVIGDADWLGNWSLGSNLGLMTETAPGIYQNTFRNVQPGTYYLSIVKNDNWLERWGNGDDYFTFTLEKQADITVVFTLKNGEGLISVQEATPDEPTNIGNQEPNPKTLDLNVRLLAALLLCCAAVLPLLLRKREEML